MTADDFHALYDKRLRDYVAYYVRKKKLPNHLKDDFYQNAWLIIGKALRTWSPEGGQNAFNWCEPAIRRQLRAAHRRHLGHKGFSWRVEASEFIVPMGDMECVAEDEHLDLRIDVARISNVKSPDSRNYSRFLRAALNEETGADIASLDGQSRQAVNHSLRQERKRLARIFIDYQDDWPSEQAESRRRMGWGECTDFKQGLDNDNF